MIKYKESAASANFNYLINDKLMFSYAAGEPLSEDGFFFLAKLVGHDKNKPCISARLFDDQGKILVEIQCNTIKKEYKSRGYICTPIPNGFRITDHLSNILFEVCTHEFTNGFLSYIKTKSFDEDGVLRIDTYGNSIHFHR